MEEITIQFNKVFDLMVDFILSIYDSRSIKLNKTIIDNMRKINKYKIIEEYILWILPYYDKIKGQDEIYFITIMNCTNNKEHEDIRQVLGYFKFLEVLKHFDEDNNKIVFEYQILLCDYAIEYLNMKLHNHSNDT